MPGIGQNGSRLGTSSKNRETLPNESRAPTSTRQVPYLEPRLSQSPRTSRQVQGTRGQSTRIKDVECKNERGVACVGRKAETGRGADRLSQRTGERKRSAAREVSHISSPRKIR